MVVRYTQRNTTTFVTQNNFRSYITPEQDGTKLLLLKINTLSIDASFVVAIFLITTHVASSRHQYHNFLHARNAGGCNQTNTSSASLISSTQHSIFIVVSPWKHKVPPERRRSILIWRGIKLVSLVCLRRSVDLLKENGNDFLFRKRTINHHINTTVTLMVSFSLSKKGKSIANKI